MPDIEPIGQCTFSIANLTRDYPPRFSHPLKRLVVGGITASVQGTLEFSRWRGGLPEELKLASGTTLEQHEDVFAYGPEALDTMAWYLNFADPHLFGFYGGGLLAQDEHQVLEHPTLGSLREALLERSSTEPALSPLTRTEGPTPCLVKGAPRNLVFDTIAGPYGNAFVASSPTRVRDATRYLRPPTTSNILAVAAPPPGYGVYSRGEIEDVLLTAYVGFSACRLESSDARTVIHTGNWGCGAFGGNVTLMTMLQVLAARLARIDRMIFHTVSASFTRGYEQALELVEQVAPESSIARDDLVENVQRLALRWGVSDGN